RNAPYLTAADGLKVTAIAQMAPGATVKHPNGVAVKTPLSVPTLLTCRSAEPVLATVTIWAEDVVPTSCDPNDKLAGLTWATGAPVAAAGPVAIANSPPATNAEPATIANTLRITGHLAISRPGPGAPLPPL